ncbi:MAG: protein translocase subunit SecF [Gammaproteobacteria bacterium CG22_combo_CG10-13_8_21_14_all_40_8]|nr:MAG: protein translocase subunit SecF [Gammaproteobacteria bacterium CG22_combo_CG10-13_8_21_14_all_40_8]
MTLLSERLNLDFLKVGKVALGFSLLLILISVGSLFKNGLDFGLDFTGGAMIEVQFEKDADLPKIRQQLETNGIEKAVVQTFGSNDEVKIRLPILKGQETENLSKNLMDILSADGTKVKLKETEIIHPAIGDEMTEQGILAVVIMLICIMLYVAVRFEWKFSVGAVAALAHDVIITVGMFSLLHLEFDLTVLAAILAVIGYSLNDTIVVYDRIRENFLKIRKGTPGDVVNRSLNQTLTRTLITSGTTLFVLFALFVWGGQTIHGFSSALLIGIMIGTYSSIYVASTLALYLGVSREDLMPPQLEKEGADQEALM